MAFIAAVPVALTAASVAVEGAKLGFEAGKVAAPVAKKAARAGSVMAERLLMATVIFICIILLVVGYSLWSNYTGVATGLIIAGIGGIAGTIYWSRNTVTSEIFGPTADAKTTGADESDSDVEFDGEQFEDPIEDVDYIKVEYPTEKMSKLIDFLAESTEESYQRVRKIIEQKGKVLEESTKKTLASIERNAPKIVAMVKGDDNKIKEMSSILGEMKKLCIETSASSGEIEDKIEALVKSLSV